MPYLYNQHTCTALEYEIVHTSPANTDTPIKSRCRHGDDRKRQGGRQVPTSGCGGTAASATAALWCKVSEQLQTQTNLKTLLFPLFMPNTVNLQRGLTGSGPDWYKHSSQSSDSTAKITGVGIIHEKLSIPARTLTHDYMPIYQSHWLYLPMLAAVGVFLILPLETMVPSS